MNADVATLAIAERLLDPAVVAAAAPSDEPASLGNGLAGTALLHARLACVDPRFERAARAHWDNAALEAARAPWRGGGIYSDFGGLAASLVIGSPYLPDPDVVSPARDRSVRWLSAFAARVADAYTDTSADAGTTWQVYDTVTGLAGIGRVLLAAQVNGQPSAELGLHAALRALTTMLTDRDTPRPGWWIATDQHPLLVAARLGPSGAADTGLAHGLAGPLALLALARSAGYTVPGQEAAIRDAIAWLRRWHRADGGWPSSVSGDELDTGTPPAEPARRVAWCYGVPGIARALWLGANALGDGAEVAAAQSDLAGLAASPGSWDVHGPTLCHGHAGVLRCAAGAASEVADLAARAVLESLTVGYPFLARHVEHGVSYDHPGFLTGAAGVALALAEQAHLPTAPVKTPWDALLLVS